MNSWKNKHHLNLKEMMKWFLYEKSRHLSVELIHSYIVGKNMSVLAEYIDKAHPADIAYYFLRKIEDALLFLGLW